MVGLLVKTIHIISYIKEAQVDDRCVPEVFMLTWIGSDIKV